MIAIRKHKRAKYSVIFDNENEKLARQNYEKNSQKIG